ncbi:S-layer homology domain-containing protein [Paenibacillus protaetiae]|uniref:S-layer homology domain-containing protein n=1 Tax=Paenibacillus protaetiae TaxID=2509456 RepID=A0A4P6ETX5_9BACL|nr:S-layer homology domain-containing protein [Paenibacillus protaetiae]QAY66106.1 S-layer homology domain-containing protein [Paenibacillus protaetiae]
MPFTRKTIVASALAVSLLSGGAAAGSVYAAASSPVTFSDVVSTHWAEKDITKLAMQGIITGYNGLFRPSDSVTRQEAVLMALRFAGLDDEVETNSVVVFPSSFEVSNFYKSYVALAFDKNLLDRNDEYALASSQTATAWGTAPASREWVTKLLVRTIGEKTKADMLQSTPSSFGDAGNIGKDYLGYVNAAVSLQLVKGVTETKFDPKANVNRASLATLFSRAERQYPVAYAGQQDGIVSKLSSSSISVYSDNSENTYSIDGNTRIYRYDSEQAVSLDALKLYTDVTVIGQNGKALYIEINGDEQHVQSYEAVLDRVIKSDNLMYVWINDKPVEVHYGDDLIVQDGSGKTIPLEQISRDSVITITEDAFRPAPVALSVKVKSAVEASLEGTFYSAGDGIITIMQNGSPVSKVLDSDVTVSIPGVTGAVLSDLTKTVDSVKLTLDDNGIVTKIEVTNRDVKAVAGASITSYDAVNKLLTMVDSNGTTPYALFVNDKTKFKYDGNTITLSEANSMLKAGRTISVTYSGTTVLSVEFLTSYSGVLTNTGVSGKLTLKLDNGSSVTVPYTYPDVEIAGDSTPAVSDLKAGQYVTIKLTASQDRASVIKVHQTIQYDVVKSIEGSNKLQLLGVDGTALRLDLTGVDLMDTDGEEVSLSDFVPGSVVNVAYNGNAPETVTEVPLTVGMVKTVGTGSLTVTANNGKSIIVPFDGGTDQLYIDGKKTAALSSVKTGQGAAVMTDAAGNTVIYASSGLSRAVSSYDAVSDQLITLQTSASDQNNYFFLLPNTAFTAKDGSTISPASLNHGDTVTVYAFRNTAIAVVKN